MSSAHRRTLIVAGRPERGGIEQGTRQGRIELLSQLGWSVELVAVDVLRPASGVAPDAVRQVFQRRIEDAFDRVRPEVLLLEENIGDLAIDTLREARTRGVPSALWVQGCAPRDVQSCAADAVIGPTRFAADHFHAVFGRSCTVLPDVIPPQSALSPRSIHDTLI